MLSYQLISAIYEKNWGKPFKNQLSPQKAIKWRLNSNP